MEGYVLPLMQASRVRIATAVDWGVEVAAEELVVVLQGAAGREEDGAEDEEENDGTAGKEEMVSKANTVSTSPA